MRTASRASSVTECLLRRALRFRMRRWSAVALGLALFVGGSLFGMLIDGDRRGPAAGGRPKAYLERALEGRALGVKRSSEEVRSARASLKHIVFIVKENRTFDHYFGRFPGADGATNAPTCDGG